LPKTNEDLQPSNKYSTVLKSVVLLGNLLSPIEALISVKLGSEYAGPSSITDRSSVLRRLKHVMIAEIDTLRKQNKLFQPPFDPLKVQKVGKAVIEIEYAPRSDVGGDGSLKPVDKGFLIKIDETLFHRKTPQYRLRSTVAHELMHALFYDTSRIPPRKLGLAIRSRKHFFMEEELCYYLAREFLVPNSLIHELMNKDASLQSPSLRNIDFLKSTYFVSSDIIAYKMIADLLLWNAIFIKFVKENSFYRSRTKLKNKKNPLYRKIKIPYYIPQNDTSEEWLRLLSEHVSNAARNGEFLELISILSHRLALESKIETKNPLSVITIVYEEN